MSIHHRAKLPGTLRAIAAVPTREKCRPTRLTEEDAARALARFGAASYVANLDGDILYFNPQYEKIAHDIRGDRHDLSRPIFAIGEVIGRILAG